MYEDLIKDGLEQDAQAYLERIPVDKGKKANKELIAELKTFLADRDISQSEFARRLGVSPATLSQYLRNRYAGKVGEIENTVVNVMESMRRREDKDRSALFIMTSVAEKIGTLIVQTDGFSVDEGKIGLVVGDGGHGKSKCLEHFAEVNKNAVYVELDRAMTSTMIFAEIAKAMGLNSIGSMANVTRRIIDELKSRKLTLLIDEASFLKVKQLDMLRQVLTVKGGCPMILSGNRALLNTIMQPTTMQGYESLDQITSRLMGVVDLDKLAVEKGDDGKPRIYTSKDIRALYEYKGVTLSKGAVDTFRAICCSPRSGRLRICTLIVAALHTAKEVTKGGKIERVHIEAAIEQLQLPVKPFLPVHTERRNKQTRGASVAAAAG